MTFEFTTTPGIIFGEGTRNQVPALARAFGQRVMLVVGANLSRHAAFAKSLGEAGLSPVVCSINSEPDIERCEAESIFCRENNISLVIGLGGGSVLDAGKAIAALATNPPPALDYLEVIGKGRPLVHPPLPFIALPTTSGTGSEATRNAVLTSKAHQVKVSLRSPLMYPRVAVVDPELTLDLPPNITASTGMDALTQLVESFTSTRANPLTDSFCKEGIPRVARFLPKAVENGHDIQARRNLSLASLLSGMALANSGLGAVHGFAAPLGGMFGAPHGAICAALLPMVFEANYREACRLNSPLAARFKQTAGFLTGNSASNAEDGIKWLKDLKERLNIPRLRDLGIIREELQGIVLPAQKTSSMRGNPVPLSDAQLLEILHAAW